MTNYFLPLILNKVKHYQRRYLKYDVTAAIVVCLVAIPLCLGIALASGAPLFSGILGGIFGGIVVGAISNSPVSVSGPAAGMAAVVFTAITQLGDFNAFLLALTLAGVLQIIMGSKRAGFIADYVPSNIVQGLLCAIGILLIIKQLPLAFTLTKDLKELKYHLLDSTESFALHPLTQISNHINTGAVIITFISMAILIYFDKTKAKLLKNIPAPIIVVIFGIVINELFIMTNSLFMQNSPQLVNIPKHHSFIDFFHQFQFPAWSSYTNPKIYLYAVVIAIVASLETLLNIKAGEKLDKKHRYCSKDRELVAQGVGNVCAGLVGGIPITSVIVRTSVNIQAGAKTKMATILHGLLLLFAVLLIPGMLNKIPLSSLAAILIYTGYKLTKPTIYYTIYHQGMERFIPFIATVISIVAFNLLAGIVIGLVISMFYILKTNSQARLNIVREKYPDAIISRLILPEQITFLNKASLIAELDSIPNNSHLIIDARYTNYIDKEIVELIKDFQKDQAQNKEINLNLVGFKDKYDIHNHIDYIQVTTYEARAKLTPVEVLAILQEGNQRFLNDTRIHQSSKIEIQCKALTPAPIAVILGCIDSRVPVETIFDLIFGDLFCVRVAGNVVNDDILASMEYACHVVGAKLIVVLGHNHCGAIKAACDDVEKGHITQLLAKIKPAVNAESETSSNRNSNNTDFVNHVTSLNIANTLQQIYQSSEILRIMIDQDQIGIVGAIYNIETGEVTFGDYAQDIAQLNNENSYKIAEKTQSLIEQANAKALDKLSE